MSQPIHEETVVYYGKTLKDAFEAAEKKLEENIDELNALNVYPVPDGDTGTNMFLTIQAAYASLDEVDSNSSSEVVRKFARGALLGARGNSGVLLSQIFRGMAGILDTKEFFTADDFAQALWNGSNTAYRALSQPVEGTILTVIREAADIACKKNGDNCTLQQTITAVEGQAWKTVKRTPDLLPMLREAGVVDAGGKGLAYIFQGMKQSILAETPLLRRRSRNEPTIREQQDAEVLTYGVELQFLINGDDLDAVKIRDTLSEMGNSVLVVGDEKILRVHIHTKDPQPVIDYCETTGRLTDIAREDLDKQVARFKARR
ncbi:MAG: DAK2 domain-containing protein [Dehalococcoidales bacterium]|nr:DAK2 domain-containing protein [Dehalococcoidales bacterium]